MGLGRQQSGGKPNGAIPAGQIEVLRRERDRFVALAFCNADVLFELDQDGRIVFAAGATTVITGLSPDKLRGKRLAELAAVEHRKTLETLLTNIQSGDRLDNVAVRFAGPQGPTPVLNLSGYHIKDLSEHSFLSLRMAPPVFLPDTSNAERSSDTGVLTKGSFAEVAGKAAKDAAAAGEDCQLTLFNLGEIKALRARLDAEAQAELAATIGAQLRAKSLGGDTAGELDESRYGVLHRLDVDVAAVGNEIEAFATKLDPDGVGIRIGRSTIEVDAAGLSEKDTARALLHALNRYCDDADDTFTIKSLSESLSGLAEETVQRIEQTKRVIAENDFQIAFQPICDLATRKVHHFEALVRLDPARTGAPQDQFIAFAEEVGVICDFDLAMVGSVLRWLAKANQIGYKYVVAVNLSGRSLSTPSFVGSLLDLLAENATQRSNVVFEVTETAKIGDLACTNQVIQGLRGAGHLVCLDDFGAGEAAFQYLGALDVDVVKIDGQYVRNAMESRRGKALLRAMAGLCRDLGIVTIAEMIEDEQQAALVLGCGIVYGQGYLFGRPSLHISNFEAPAPVAFASHDDESGQTSAVRR